MFVSDAVRGELWRISSTSAGNYTSQLHISGFKRVLGLAHDPSIPDGG